MEQTSNVGDTRKLKQMIRQFSGRPSILSDTVRNGNGSFIAKYPAMVKRYHEHFENLFNFATEPSIPLPLATESPPFPAHAVSCNPPSEGEVTDAIRRLRKNKAPGEDGIPSEIFNLVSKQWRPGSMKRLHKRGQMSLFLISGARVSLCLSTRRETKRDAKTTVA